MYKGGGTRDREVVPQKKEGGREGDTRKNKGGQGRGGEGSPKTLSFLFRRPYLGPICIVKDFIV